MRRKKRFPETGTICKTLTVLITIWFMAPNTAFSQSVGAYGIEYYRSAGPEPEPAWQHDLPGVYQKLQNFLTDMDNLGATTSNSHFGSNVSRSNIQAKYTTGFDRYNMVYWQAHTHTLPYNKPSLGKTYWWYDPDDLLNWGTQSNPYLPGWDTYYNPSWFQYPCAQNAGPGYTAAFNTDWKTTSLPMWNGYYGRHAGEAALTKCDLSRHNGNGLGQNNNKWMIMDSCDAVRVAYHSTPYNSMDHGVISWDQTFDGMHGVYGHYDSIYLDYDKADDFAQFLEDGLTIWEAYKQASLNYPLTNNEKVSVITAENKQRIPYYFGGQIIWMYPYWDQMAITDHWYGYGNVSNDIAAQDIEYFYTTYYVPN